MKFAANRLDNILYLAGLGSLLFWVLHSLLASHFWLWELTSFIPPFVIPFIYIIFAGVVIWRQQIPLLFIIIITTILWLPFMDFGMHLPSAAQQHHAEKVLKIFTWNTEFWDRKESKEEFLHFLKSQQADIYHLQEGFREKFDFINAKAELEEAFPGFNIAQSEELVTLSKYPITEIEKQNIPNSLWAGYLQTDIEIEDKVVSLYNVHIPVQVDMRQVDKPLAFFQTMQTLHSQRSIIRTRLLQNLSNQTNPTLISGDFNSTAMQGYTQPIERLGYKDSFTDSSFGFPTTWSLGKLKLWRIDWTFTNNQIQVLKHEYINPQDKSDHWGSLVNFTLSN